MGRRINSICGGERGGKGTLRPCKMFLNQAKSEMVVTYYSDKMCRLNPQVFTCACSKVGRLWCMVHNDSITDVFTWKEISGYCELLGCSFSNIITSNEIRETYSSLNIHRSFSDGHKYMDIFLRCSIQ